MKFIISVALLGTAFAQQSFVANIKGLLKENLAKPKPAIKEDPDITILQSVELFVAAGASFESEGEPFITLDQLKALFA